MWYRKCEELITEKAVSSCQQGFVHSAAIAYAETIITFDIQIRKRKLLTHYHLLKQLTNVSVEVS